MINDSLCGQYQQKLVEHFKIRANQIAILAPIVERCINDDSHYAIRNLAGYLFRERVEELVNLKYLSEIRGNSDISERKRIEHIIATLQQGFCDEAESAFALFGEFQQLCELSPSLSEEEFIKTGAEILSELAEDLPLTGVDGALCEMLAQKMYQHQNRQAELEMIASMMFASMKKGNFIEAGVVDADVIKEAIDVWFVIGNFIFRVSRGMPMPESLISIKGAISKVNIDLDAGVKGDVINMMSERIYQHFILEQKLRVVHAA